MTQLISLLAQAAPEAGTTSIWSNPIVRIAAGVAALAIIVIIVIRRKKKTSKEDWS